MTALPVTFKVCATRTALRRVCCAIVAVFVVLQLLLLLVLALRSRRAAKRPR